MVLETAESLSCIWVHFYDSDSSTIKCTRHFNWNIFQIWKSFYFSILAFWTFEMWKIFSNWAIFPLFVCLVCFLKIPLYVLHRTDWCAVIYSGFSCWINVSEPAWMRPIWICEWKDIWYHETQAKLGSPIQLSVDTWQVDFAQ